MRVHHFSHVLEPPKNQYKCGVVGVPQKMFLFFGPHFRVFFGIIAHIYNYIGIYKRSSAAFFFCNPTHKQKCVRAPAHGSFMEERAAKVV